MFVPTHKHKMTGREYRIVGPAKMQCAEPVRDMQEVLVYEDAKGNRWVRPPGEFNGGRFERIGGSKDQPLHAKAKRVDED